MAETREKTAPPVGALNLLALGRAFAAIRTDSGDDCPQAEPQAPSLDGYTLTERLGAGGGGVVYKGYRAGSDRALAIKLIRQHSGPSDQGSRRAWRELELLMQVRLACIPRVIDYGWADGRLYIASEFVDGLPLDRYCQTASLDRRARVELLALVADAVQALHEQGVIHRDIKPSNVLIDRAGRPVIIDLGIATLLAHDVMATLTAEGAPIGSPAFMAPEQARGDREMISTRTDVYGLGATAFLVLTGTTPHDTATTIHEAVRRVAQDPARRARDLELGLPRALASVLDKAVSARPEDRYSTAAALAADLRRWLQGAPVLAGKPGMWARTVGWIARHPVATTAAACLSVLALAVAGALLLTWWYSLRPESLREGPHGKGVELLSRAGHVVHAWDLREDESVRGFQLVDRAPEHGGGRVALLGLNRGRARDLQPEGLCAFALDRPAIPLWSSGSRPPHLVMPPHPNFTAGQQFGLYLRAELCEIFDPPGLEALAVHAHVKWSPTAVRVYDMAGTVRYEAWHDGYIESVMWLPGPRLIIACGVNSEVYWRGRGVEGLKDFPLVVMALRAEDGVRGGWISTSSRRGQIEPAWYKCLLPAEAAEVFHPSRKGRGIWPTLARTRDTSSFVDIELVADYGAFVSMTLDAAGNIISQSESAEYGQRAVPGSVLPDPKSLKLGDLPPIMPGGEAFRPANN